MARRASSPSTATDLSFTRPSAARARSRRRHRGGRERASGEAGPTGAPRTALQAGELDGRYQHERAGQQSRLGCQGTTLHELEPGHIGTEGRRNSCHGEQHYCDADENPGSARAESAGTRYCSDADDKPHDTRQEKRSERLESCDGDGPSNAPLWSHFRRRRGHTNTTRQNTTATTLTAPSTSKRGWVPNRSSRTFPGTFASIHPACVSSETGVPRE